MIYMPKKNSEDENEFNPFSIENLNKTMDGLIEDGMISEKPKIIKVTQNEESHIIYNTKNKKLHELKMEYDSENQKIYVDSKEVED